MVCKDIWEWIRTKKIIKPWWKELAILRFIYVLVFLAIVLYCRYTCLCFTYIHIYVFIQSNIFTYILSCIYQTLLMIPDVLFRRTCEPNNTSFSLKTRRVTASYFSWFMFFMDGMGTSRGLIEILNCVLYRPLFVRGNAFYLKKLSQFVKKNVIGHTTISNACPLITWDRYTLVNSLGLRSLLINFCLHLIRHGILDNILGHGQICIPRLGPVSTKSRGREIRV